ncbi:MAG: tyrosine--tRNA ligase [Planctomycetes bacterium]|jgi:tyrosyl-tRNA synthetase|nr:tyrosine--tRNA ligase [Planctomycetota bacterium]
MSKVLTDKNLIEKFLTRGVEAIYPTVDDLRKKLLSGERLRIYQGFDPTGPYLHVGHAIGIRGLRILQQLGHEVIFLVGDYTAKVGDPDKNSTRKMLSDEDIENNMAGWKEQASQLIDFGGDNPVQFKRNYEWLSKLNLNDLIKLMSQTTVQRMMERDLFERRLKENNPIHLHEFIYPLMQGYDGVAMEVDMEIGGADQIFNMLTGRTLSRAYLNKEKFVRANKMMDAPDGRTMSKTKGNGINLGDSAEDMYGKAMSYPDSAITSGLEMLTDVPMEQIKEISEEIKKGSNPMQFKKLMAYEIVKTIKGEEAALKGKKYFEDTVQHKEIPQDIREVKLSSDQKTIIELLVISGLAKSNGEARRLIQQKGVKIKNGAEDFKVIDDINEIIVLTDETILQKGKLDFIKFRIK